METSLYLLSNDLSWFEIPYGTNPQRPTMEHFEGIKNVNFKWRGFRKRNTTMWSSVGAFEGHIWACNKKCLEKIQIVTYGAPIPRLETPLSSSHKPITLHLTLAHLWTLHQLEMMVRSHWQNQIKDVTKPI